MEVMSSPYKSAPDSPSRQLLRELNQLTISAQEAFYSQLDREAEEREALHKKALAAAAAQHESVRKSVELERQRLDAQIQAERERREAEARRELDQQRKEKAEREIAEKRREIERARAVEAEQKRLAEIERSAREAKEASRIRQEEDKAEAGRKAKEQQDAARQRAVQAQARSQAALQAAQTNSPKDQRPTPLAGPSDAHLRPQLITAPVKHRALNPQWEAEHNRYRDIHKRLKELRVFMAAQGKDSKPLKDAMGDMRREMKKCVGQLTEGKGANRQPVSIAAISSV